MKLLVNTAIKQSLTALVLTAAFLPATAQKQPQIQEVSVRAPANIKIDGLLNEWPDQWLNAHNSTNRFYYVVSNDDNNLYFTIRGQGQGVAFKVLNGGLSITISHSLDKKGRLKAKDNVAITFPVAPDYMTVAQIMGPVAISTQDPDIVDNPFKIDSLIAIANERLTNAMKEIRIVGVKEFPDSVISIYNTNGIKAVTRFMVSAANRQPVYELAIPLKYLGLSIDNPVKFSYNIKLNEPTGQIVGSGGIKFLPPGGSNAGLPEPMGALNTPLPNPNDIFKENPTDFWGVYTLAKKP